MLSKHFPDGRGARSVQGVTETMERPRLAPRGRAIGVAAAAGLAAAMGVGRFVFTPLLPIMTASTGLGAGDSAVIATGNYAGYLVGALLLTRLPQLSRRGTFLAWSLVLIASEAAMAASAQVAVHTALRFAAGVASAAIFIACASTVSRHRAEGASLGVAFAGVGSGIAVTGLFTLLAGPHLSWQGLWIGSAVLTALLLAPAWLLDIRPEIGTDVTGSRPAPGPRERRAWLLLLGAYFAEGVGYIIVGTFLVAAVAGPDTTAATGPALWLVVGLAAAPATVAWHAVARRFGTGRALVAALTVQAVGVAAPALHDGLVAALISALAFGGTFMGVVVLAIDLGNRLPVARPAATLTTLYAIGQVIGPLLVVPVLGSSFTGAFAIAAVIVAVAAALAAGAARAAAPS